MLLCIAKQSFNYRQNLVKQTFLYHNLCHLKRNVSAVPDNLINGESVRIVLTGYKNGYIESFNGKLLDEVLNREIFNTLFEAKLLVVRWR